MAPILVQDMFIGAVRRGDRAQWQQILSEQEPDLGQCLLDAVRLQCPKAVKDILQYRPPLNVEDGEGQRAIHLAAKYGPPDTIHLLLSAGCTVNGSNREGWTPLHIACQHGVGGLVEELISRGANVNAARTEDKLTPLHTAVQTGNEDIVHTLVNHGADLNIRSSQKHGQVSPLALAVMDEKPHVLEILLQHASSSNEVEYTDGGGSYPLHTAMEKGDAQSCQLLLAYLGHLKPMVRCYGIRGEEFREKRVRHVCGEEIKREEVLLDLQDRHGRTALHLAILCNRRESVEALLDAGCNTCLSYQNMRPLELAAKCVQPLNATHLLPIDCEERRQKVIDGAEWDEAVIRLLMERSINMQGTTIKGEYPIHFMLSAGLYDVALKIVSEMPDKIDQTNAFGETPLHLACKFSSSDIRPRIELITVLLEMGLSVNAVTTNGMCPLSFAVIDGRMEIISILLGCSPDMGVRARNGFTPLHYAAIGQNVAVLEALLDARPEAILADGAGPSPLHIAVLERKVDMVRCLLQRQADPNHRDPVSGASPLHTAVRKFVGSLHAKTYVTMIELLVKNGADLAMRDSSDLTPVQAMIQALLCCSILPNGRELASSAGLSALRILVEAGSRLEPWALTEAGISRRTPLQSMAFCGLLPCVYYLANVGWPLSTEIQSCPSPRDRQPVSNQHYWVHLPGNTAAQDNLHAFLMLRNANPFSLLELARSTVRRCLMERSMEAHGGQRREVVSLVERLPAPDVVKKYLTFQDLDYSSAERSWENMLHLLPSAATEEATKAGLTS